MWGQGILKKKDGIYQGGFNKNNKVSGPLKTETGTYEGSFINGQMSGKGKFSWKNGNNYIGDFKYNKLDGDGELILKSGTKYRGRWKNGINTEIIEV